MGEREGEETARGERALISGDLRWQVKEKQFLEQSSVMGGDRGSSRTDQPPGSEASTQMVGGGARTHGEGLRTAEGTGVVKAQWW